MRVVILAAGDHERALAERAAVGLAGVRICERADALRTLAELPSVRVVVSGARDRAGVSVAPVLAALLERAPAPAVLLHIPATNAAARELLELVQRGVHARVVLRDLEDLAVALREALTSAGEPGAEYSILESIAPHVPRSLHAFFALCAIKGSTPLTVARVAELCRTPRRTLEDRLHRASLPTARRIVAWCRVLHAAWRLDVLDRRPKQVVAEMAFPSYAALSNLVARHCGCTPSTVREVGGYPALLGRFVELLRERGRVGDEEPGPEPV